MIFNRKDLRVDKVIYGKNNAELVKVRIRGENKTWRNFAIVYVPPKTRSWGNIEHKELQKETLSEMENLLNHCDNLTIMGDFNCREVNWEEWTTEGIDESWGSKMLKLAMENTLTQWIAEKTRFRGDDKPSRLDLVFTKDPDGIDDITYGCPLGKSDHVIIELLMSENLKYIREENHRIGRLNYRRANYKAMKQYFTKVDWRDFDVANSIDKKWDLFLEIYNDLCKSTCTKREQKRDYKKRLV